MQSLKSHIQFHCLGLEEQGTRAGERCKYLAIADTKEGRPGTGCAERNVCFSSLSIELDVAANHGHCTCSLGLN